MKLGALVILSFPYKNGWITIKGNKIHMSKHYLTFSFGRNLNEQ